MNDVFCKALAVMRYIASGATMGYAYKCGDKNNPALHIALAMVKLITEAGGKNE